MAATKGKDTAEDGCSLATLWAHLLGDDGEIVYQVEILRPGPVGTWIVQYYSFLTGDPTNVGIVAEATLLDDKKCALYLDSDAMNVAYEYGSLGYHSQRVSTQRLAKAKGPA